MAAFKVFPAGRGYSTVLFWEFTGEDLSLPCLLQVTVI